MEGVSFNMIRRCLHVLLLFIVVSCFAATSANAQREEPPFSALVSVTGFGDINIPLQHTSTGDYLFLPSCTDLDALVLQFSESSARIIGDRGSLNVKSGEPFSLYKVSAGEAERFELTFIVGEKQIAFTLMHSASIRTAFLVSGDEQQGRSYVEADKERKVKGVSFALLRADGSVIWAGPLKNIKGRGNSTWHYPKKPYQIKLTEKVDLLETGDKAERENTWILLANYIDESLIRNQITFDLAAECKLAFSPHCASVDLYYDGEYRGVYLLCEKTEISRGRVSIRNLEKDIEEANPGVKDFAELTREEKTLDGGLAFQYCPELIPPEDIRGGYLLELDYGPRAMAEASWFCTECGQYVTVKSPEYLPEEGMRYIASLYQRFERAVFAGGVDPQTGDDYRELCDLESLARCCLLLELAKDNDAFLSSTFFYKPEGEEKLYAGQVWDFDTGYGIADLPEDISVISRTLIGNRLLAIPSFREALKTCWDELKPLVYDLVLSDDPESTGLRLQSLTGYDRLCADARRMDRALWEREGPDQSISELRSFLIRRAAWLEDRINVWYAGDIPDRLFSDVNENHWFYASVVYAVEHGLFTGTTPIQFEPFRYIDRAMLVSVLHRMTGAQPADTHFRYSDVDPAAWYSAAVDWATEAGITDGVGKNRFAPGSIVTREQMITLLYRVIRYSGFEIEAGGGLSAFADSTQISPWAYDAMVWAVDNGIILGSNGRLDPKGKTTRAQAAVIISRAYQAYFGKESPD